jgi:FkbM family methyltransferase
MYMKSYFFPFNDVEKGSNIVVYGAGVVAQDLIHQAQLLKYCNIVAVCDKRFDKIGTVRGIQVVAPSSLSALQYDKIVIAAKARFDESIRKDLYDMGVTSSKMVSCIVDGKECIVHKTAISPWGRLSCSYHCEDMIALWTLRALGVEKFSYMDVGGYDPWEGSNTALMYLGGMRGIVIDASSSAVEKFRKERPEDTSIRCLIGKQEGEMEFYELDRGGLSTANSNLFENYDVWLQQSAKRVTLPCRTLDSIVEEYAGGVYPEYLDVDVEGLDFEVLSACHFSADTPYIICAEIKEPYCTLRQMSEMLLHKGYALYFVSGDDAIYLKQGLKQRLRIIP